MFCSSEEKNDKPRQNIKKQRHHFADRGPYSQSCVFSSSHVWMWELDHKEAWVPKNWCFELWCWRRLLRVPWTARRANQSVRKEISPEYSVEGPMLKLKLQYFGHVMWRADSLEKTLMLGKTEGKKRRGRAEEEMVGWHRRLNGHVFEQLWEIVRDREAWHAAVHEIAKSWAQLSDWTATKANRASNPKAPCSSASTKSPSTSHCRSGQPSRCPESRKVRPALSLVPTLSIWSLLPSLGGALLLWDPSAQSVMGPQMHQMGPWWPLGSLPKEQERVEEEEAEDSCVEGLNGSQALGWPPAGEWEAMRRIPSSPLQGPTPAESSLLAPKSN